MNPILKATRFGRITLVGSFGPFPRKIGNCFDLIVGKKRFRVINFVYENLEYLIKHGLKWPIKILPLEASWAVIHDARIPDEWYATKFCEVCTPESLLPLPQKLAHERQNERGERSETGGWVKIDRSKRPVLLGLPTKKEPDFTGYRQVFLPPGGAPVIFKDPCGLDKF